MREYTDEASLAPITTEKTIHVQVTHVGSDAPVGGQVPATLALTVGAPASFGAFTPGVTKNYDGLDDRQRRLDGRRRGARRSTAAALANGAVQAGRRSGLRCRRKTAGRGPVTNDVFAIALQAVDQRDGPAAHGRLRARRSRTR